MTIASNRPRRIRVALTTVSALLGLGALAACSSTAVDVLPQPVPQDTEAVTPDPTNLPVVTIAGTFAYGQDGGQGCAYVLSAGKRYNIVLFDEQTLTGDGGLAFIVLKPDDLPTGTVPNAALAARPDVIGLGERLTVTGEKWLPDEISDTICRPFDAQINLTKPIKAG